MNNTEIRALVNAPYFHNPSPDAAREILGICRSDTTVGVKATMLALLEAHPDQAVAWRTELSFYIEQAERVIQNTPPDHVGWNDYYMARWLILGDPASIPELVRRTTLPGRVGELAKWMVTSMRRECLPFDKAICTHTGEMLNLAPRYAMNDGGPLAVLRPEDVTRKVAGLKMLKPCMGSQDRKAAMDRLIEEQPHLFVGWLSSSGLQVLDGWGHKRFNVEPGDSLVACGQGRDISLPDFMM